MNAAALRIAIEGQRLLNQVGLRLASDAGVVDSLQLSAASQHDDTARLAEALEIWMEAYAAQWSMASRDSELQRLQEVVFRVADHLRSASRVQSVL